MSLEGSIKDFGLSDIFQLIHVQQKSGLMTVQHQARKATVGFVKGMVVSAQSDDQDGAERIGDVLVRAKRITAHQLQSALKLQQERGEYLGQILVAEGMLSSDDLRRALRLQTLEAVYRLFRWREGRYAFDQQPVSYPKEYLEPISTEHILMEGIRRLDEWPYIEKKIASLHVVFAQVPGKAGEIDQPAAPKPTQPAAGDDPLGDLDVGSEGRFSPDEITVFRAVDGTQPVSQLIAVAQLGEFEVCKALANLLTAGLVVPVASPDVQETVRDEVDLEPGRLRVWLSTSLQWTANVVLIGALAGGALWCATQAWDYLEPQVGADLRAVELVIQPHYLKSLRELIHVWIADRGGVPGSVAEAIRTYGALSWPLTDPWGRPWIYDSITDTVSADLLGSDP